MNQFPLLSMEQTIDMIKQLHDRNPAFGMDIYEENFQVKDFLILENNGEGRASSYTRCEYYILILSLKGKSIRHINQHDYMIESQSLQLLTPGVIHSFDDVSEEQNSYLIIFNKKFFDTELKNLLEFHSLDLSPANFQGSEFEKIKNIYEQIDFEYKYKQEDYKQMTKSLVTQLLLILKRKKLFYSKNRVQNRAEQIFSQYLNLIEKHYQSKKVIQEYADILEVTAKHLSETVKEVSGKSALIYIHTRILKEIKYLLVYTNLNIQQIATMLSFKNSSEFSRFFKRYEGISPSKYRLSFKNP
ncbi:helix-turn-helix transcriptional regulator [Sulfurospirillum arcachonense]|uniref:helix-turn-helix transcriptional regulator n=1 Tax=Sulfurospirillum arcachonense TaxID=57666 RepID=UPI0004684D85|nr:helix-turn-helix transcriptional regulator [Sulfurospirillum arcachonense]